MALIGISRTDTFDYVSNDDPCKHRHPKMLDVQGSDARIVDPNGGFEEVVDDGATVFKLGVLDVFLMGMIYDRSTSVHRGLSDDDVTMRTAINATNIETVRFGLKGWTGFKDPRGSEIRFEQVKRVVNGADYEVASDGMLKLLGLRLIGELAQQIKEASEVSRAEAKNSATVS